MSGTDILTALIQIIVGGLTEIGGAIGAALSEMASALFISGTGSSATLSVFAVLLAVFAAISLGFSLTRWVINWISSFGNRNR